MSRSTDNGNSWNRNNLFYGGSITVLGYDPGHPDTIYAIGHRNGDWVLYRSANNGSAWSELAFSGFEGTPVSILVSPSDPKRLAAGSSEGLFQSLDEGETWAAVTGVPEGVNDLYQSEYLDAMVICTDNGLWIWPQWTGVPLYWGEDPGIPAVRRVTDFGSNHMMAGTLGAGVWTASLESWISDQLYAPVTVPSTVCVTPNPICDGSASVGFLVPEAAQTDVLVYDLSGRLLENTFCGYLEEGFNTQQINVERLYPGVYIVIVRSGLNLKAAEFAVLK